MSRNRERECALLLVLMKALADTPGLEHFRICWTDPFSDSIEDQECYPDHLPEQIRLAGELWGFYLVGIFPLLRASPDDRLNDGFHKMRAKHGLAPVQCSVESDGTDLRLRDGSYEGAIFVNLNDLVNANPHL
jgi:hypothetical protein